MFIGFVIIVALIVAVAYYVHKHPTYSPGQEAKELLAKAETEVSTVESDVKSDVTKVETKVDTEAKTVGAEVVTDIKKI